MGSSVVMGARGAVRACARAVLAVCAAWLLTVFVLWLATSKTRPIIDVRWSQGISEQQRRQAERELGLVAYRAKDPVTWSYFLEADDRTSLRRIVNNPFVEDTAGLNRGTADLEHADSGRLWVGYRWPFLRDPVLLYLGVFGVLFAAEILWVGLRRWSIPLVGLVVLAQVVPGQLIFNDHLGYLAMSRQVLHGDLPIRDFLDHGTFLHVLLSAALQFVFGHRLLAEMLMCWAFIALGVVITHRLVLRVTGSRLASLLLMLPAVLLVPRPYSFPKAFLYPLGLLVIWRYVETPGARRLLVMGGVAALALMMRVDHGIVLLVAGVFTVALVHLPHGGRRLAVPLATLLLGFTAALLPFLVYVGATAGIAAHFSTIWAFGRYAQRHGESWQTMVRLRALSVSDGWLAPGQALPFLYDAVVILSAMAGVRCLFAILQDLRKRGAVTLGTARLGAVTAVWFLSVPMLLRDNFEVRLPDVAPVVVILAAFFLRLGWRSPEAAETGGTAQRSVVRLVSGVVASWLVLAAFVFWCGVYYWAPRQKDLREFREDHNAYFRGLAARLTLSPPLTPWLPSRSDRAPELAQYLLACTTPVDRLLTTWYAPDLFFLTDRAFAGNQWVYVSGFHDSPADQAEIVERLKRQHVPLVLVRAGSRAGFWSAWPALTRYLDERYQPDVDFSDGTTLYVDRQRPIVERLTFRNLPCFR